MSVFLTNLKKKMPVSYWSMYYLVSSELRLYNRQKYENIQGFSDFIHKNLVVKKPIPIIFEPTTLGTLKIHMNSYYIIILYKVRNPLFFETMTHEFATFSFSNQTF